jgi:hypothetical protein
MKKTSEEDSEEEGLTTADLAQGRRPAATEELARPVLAGRPASDQGYAAETMSLFPRNELEEMRVRWNGIQAAFVDEPRHAVEQADGLVATGMKRLAEVFAEERSRLEAQWDRGNNVSTEELRLALQRYRSFFHRLLNV